MNECAPCGGIMSDKEKFIGALDIGTTTLRCMIFDRSLQIRGYSCEQVQLLYPKVGYIEIDPDQFWASVVRVIKNAIENAKISVEQLESLGITTQRCTFITWHRDTGKYFHRFIVWNDVRAKELVKKWNDNILLKSFQGVSKFLYMITRNKRFLAGSVMKFMNSQVTVRLAWMIRNNDDLRKAIQNKSALFGTIDTWLLHKFQQGLNECNKKPIDHITDVTNASATGLYDPFQLNWAEWSFSLYGLTADMMPKVVDNTHDFGVIDKSIFGSEIKIGCSIADQSASMWGSCCFGKGDVKVTLGTGSFMNLNTGKDCHASIYGLYPLVAWRVFNRDSNTTEVAYCVEGQSNDTGSIIRWGIDFGLFDDPSASSDMAYSVDDSEEIFFIPAFSGLGAPMNDAKAATGVIGIRPTTTKSHIVRALLESIAYRVTQLYICTLEETDFKFSIIRVDGGVSRNDFVCQLLANLTGLEVERGDNSELSVLGTAFLAGLNAGIFQNRDELVRKRVVERVFHPQHEHSERIKGKFLRWQDAVERFRDWYDES
ncbi:putative glycerol kinase 5 isoform X1 [Lutzomyia longipalpis]|uniref:putative glycerol kinase 5 isoform X1 n=2 Tax=Lutzomyia longipalpis TaxID=7200 RepID=UPI002484506B|nr:putative glycerol kinase 5 isoform X1 [Lutzomyia longipalpis]